MLFVIPALLLVVLAVSLNGLRAADAGKRWPFVAAASLSGAAAIVITAAVVALTAGWDSWGTWLSDSVTTETITRRLAGIGGPSVLAVCCALLVLGVALRNRRHA